MTDLSENVSACEFLFSVRKMLAPLICNISNIFELLIKMKRLHRMVITQQGYSINLHQGWTMCGLIVHCCSKTMLHSFDNSIIFVYSYYINAKLYLLKVFKFIKLTEFLKDSVDNKTVKLTQDYLYLMGHISTPFTPFT